MSDGVTVDAAAPLTFGGDVKTVLDSPRAVMPPKTLEEARNQPGRREQIEQIQKLIEANDIKYVFFQQVSVTGRVMGKGVVSSFFPQVAEKGYQLVYGATANLFVDRAGDYIGFGPEECLHRTSLRACGRFTHSYRRGETPPTKKGRLEAPLLERS